MGTGSRRTLRGAWGWRARIDPSRNLGGPAEWREKRRRLGGIHNPGSGSGRESDRPIVAGKRVTTRERRGLSREVLLKEEGKTAWKRFPLRENRKPSVPCRRRSGSDGCRRNFLS